MSEPSPDPRKQRSRLSEVLRDLSLVVVLLFVALVLVFGICGGIG